MQVEVPGDPLGMGEVLVAHRVLLAGHVPGLLQEGEVDHGSGVAHGARVAVPIPGAAHVTAAFDQAHIGYAGLGQPGTGGQPGEPGADDGHCDLVGDRVALGALGVGVVAKVSEGAGGLEILVAAVGAQPLVPLGSVSCPQRVAADRLDGRVGSRAHLVLL